MEPTNNLRWKNHKVEVSVNPDVYGDFSKKIEIHRKLEQFWEFDSLDLIAIPGPWDWLNETPGKWKLVEVVE